MPHTMNTPQPEALGALADSLMRSASWLAERQQDDERMTVSRITGELWFLKSRLDSSPCQASIEECSPLALRLETCQKAMDEVKDLFDRLTSQCDNIPSGSNLPPKEWRDKLDAAFERLKRSANSLSLAIEAGLYS